MKNIFVKNLLPVAAKNSVFDLSHSHLTTMNFGDLVPVDIHYCLPNEKYKVDLSTFARTSPLYNPTYGVAKLKFYSFFVPCRILWNSFEQFVTGLKKNDKGETIGSFRTTQRNINTLFLRTIFNNSTDVVNPTDDTQFDYQFVEQENVVRYRKLTTKGKYILKILQSLGYDIDVNVGINGNSPEADYDINVLPLAAFFRAYCDFFVPSSRYPNYIESTLNQLRDTGTNFLDFNKLNDLFDNYLNYWENDYFTSQWANQNTVLSGINNNNVTPTPLQSYGAGNLHVTDNSNQQILFESQNDHTVTLNEVGLRALHQLAQWVTRNNYSGSRAVDRILSRFGVKVPNYRDNRSEFIKSGELVLNIGDVTNVADSPESPLGSFGGKAYINGTGLSYSFDTPDYGYIVTFASLNPQPLYFRGMKPDVLYSHFEEFYQPEYDGIGMVPTPNVVFNSPNTVWKFRADEGGSKQALRSKGVFGFHPRYTEYRVGFDRITGDFARNLDTFHFGRDVSDICYVSPTDIDRVTAQSTDLLVSSDVSSVGTHHGTAVSFNRVFAVTDASVDNFFVTMFFKVTAHRKVKSVSDAIDLDDEGRKIDVSVNGTHF